MRSTMKRCLLDADGVLVDFVGGVCRYHAVPNPYDNLANHGKYHVEELVAMDKAYFFAPLGEAFWANLEPTPECFDIVRLCEEVFGREAVCILTSPILTHGCHEGKLRWIRKHLPQFSRRVLIGASKEFVAGPDAWLVDDSDTNVDKFEAWGGNTVHVPRPWNRLHKFSGKVLACVAYGLPISEE